MQGQSSDLYIHPWSENLRYEPEFRLRKSSKGAKFGQCLRVSLCYDQNRYAERNLQLFRVLFRVCAKEFREISIHLTGLFLFSEKILEPLRANEYVMDVISRLDRKRMDYHMHFRRVVWFKNFRLENKLLIDLFYNQVNPSVKSGDLLGGQSFDVQLQNEASLLNALDYHIQGKRHQPNL